MKEFDLKGKKYENTNDFIRFRWNFTSNAIN